MEPINEKSGRKLSCEQWLQVLDELNIGAFTVDVNRNVSAMNFCAQALIGQKETEAVGKTCREVFLGVPCLAKCPFRAPGDLITDDPILQIQDEDQTTHLVTRMATPVFGSKGQIVGCLTILQDHSPIADLIHRIHYEEQSLKMILDNLDVGIFTTDRSGHITFFNTGAEKISGYHRRDILGEPCAVMFEGEGSPEICLLKDTIVEGTSRSTQQGNMQTRDGVTIPIQANYMALRNEKGGVVGGLTTFHDLTVIHQLKQAMKDRYTFHDMIGKSPTMLQIFEMINVVADTDATILIEGATGTGKDLLAKVIHSASRRSDEPFIKVNCAAIPDNLLESEMFGYVKGAFTGAEKDKTGRFQEAEGGTILLDEIGDLPLGLQAKLLRVLEDKEFYRLGSRNTVKVDVRIISASNRNLKKLVDKGLFREDLYYRLNVFRIELPELKMRRIDLPLLIGHILRRLCAARGTPLSDVSERTMEVLLNYDYPGNVRELENILEHALIICQGMRIQEKHLPAYLHMHQTARTTSDPHGLPRKTPATQRERKKIVAALEHHNWNRAQTARALGMDRTTLWRKMKKYGLPK